MRTIRLRLCYDGTRYRGWQRLAGEENTIQGKLETVLSRILGETIEISGSGRTDAGAHAMGQVASFHCESPMDCGELLEQLRRYLPEDIGIYSCEEAAPRFHARLNAKEKTYCYRVWNGEEPCVFDRRYVYRLEEKLSMAAMKSACECFLGIHDFSAFSSAKHSKKSNVREIYRFTVERKGPEIRFTVTGNGFLYNMVRIMVGTVLEVGMGKRGSEEILQILAGKRREAAGYTVPAKGLCLMEVRY